MKIAHLLKKISLFTSTNYILQLYIKDIKGRLIKSNRIQICFCATNAYYCMHLSMRLQFCKIFRFFFLVNNSGKFALKYVI